MLLQVLKRRMGVGGTACGGGGSAAAIELQGGLKLKQRVDAYLLKEAWETGRMVGLRKALVERGKYAYDLKDAERLTGGIGEEGRIRAKPRWSKAKQLMAGQVTSARCQTCDFFYCSGVHCAEPCDDGSDVFFFDTSLTHASVMLMPSYCADEDFDKGLASLGMIAVAVDAGSYDKRSSIGATRAKKMQTRRAHRERAANAIHALPFRASVPLVPAKHAWGASRKQRCNYRDEADAIALDEEEEVDFGNKDDDDGGDDDSAEQHVRPINDPSVQLITLLPKHQRGALASRCPHEERPSRASFAERYGHIIADAYDSPDDFPWGVFFARLDAGGQSADDAFLFTLEQSLACGLSSSSAPDAEDAALLWAIQASAQDEGERELVGTSNISSRSRGHSSKVQENADGDHLFCVEHLVAMGYRDRDAVEACLVASGGDIEGAAEELASRQQKCAQLAQMGFSDDAASRVLRETRGDLDAALEMLLAGL